ncbi:unnamed protein product, partial [Symbiodinium microadriaticum]
QPIGTARTSSGRSSQQLAAESRGSVVRPYASMPLTQSSRKSTSQQLHPSKLKWPSGGFCTLNAAADLKRWEASEELQRALTPLKALLVSGDADE